ncbi:MAG: Ig-like domain-containing protein [Burkholderiales bacterium]
MGRNVDVEVVVSNAGGSGLTTDNVVVQLSRANYLASTFTPSTGSYDAATGRWTVGTLAPGGQATLRIAGSSAQAGPAEVSASLGIATVLGFNNQDVVSANNADRESWSVPLPPRPSGLPDDYFTDEGVALVVPATGGLLANDGQSRFTVVDSVTTPTIGTLVYQADGSFTYAPPRHVAGDQRATFVYTLRDASGQSSDPVEVAIRVRDVIAPADLSLAMQMVVGGVAQTGTAFGFDPGEAFTLRLVARNDGPGDADGVTVRLPLSDDDFEVLGTLPEDADLVRDASGYLWHVGTLAEGDEVTLDIELGALRRGTFPMSAEIVQSRSPDPDSTPGNGAGEDDEAGFTVEVENAPPVAVGDRYRAEPGVVLEVSGPGVLGNDTDANGDALIVDLDALDTTGLQGTLEFIAPDGSFRFRPADGFTGTTSFRYGITDRNGAVTLGTVTLDVIARPLRVASFAPTANGFHVGFDQALDLARLNLYGTMDSAAGAADVTLVGATTGAVSGSLVIDADGSGFTFVKTGRPLESDNYTLTVRADAEGVHSVFGGLLDGDANGTAGDDHVRAFTVQAGGARVLSLSDFMRGPGQDVVVPNPSGTGALPLRLSEGNGVKQLSAELKFDASLLQIDQVRLKAGLAGRVTTSAIAGGLRIDVVLDAALGAGAIDLIEIVSRVPAGAPYGAQQVLDLTNVSLRGATGNLLPVVADDAVHTVGYFGDTTGDQSYSRADYERLLRVIVRTDSGLAAWANTDPVLVGDLNGNGQLSTLDANRLLQHVLGTARPEIPALPVLAPLAPMLARMAAPASASPVEQSTEVMTTAAGQSAVPSAMSAPVVLPEVLGPSTPPGGSTSEWKSASWAKDLTQRLQGMEVRSAAQAETGGGVVRTALRAFLKR